MRRWRRFLPVFAIAFFLWLHDGDSGEAAQPKVTPIKAPVAATTTGYTVVENPAAFARK